MHLHAFSETGESPAKHAFPGREGVTLGDGRVEISSNGVDAIKLNTQRLSTEISNSCAKSKKKRAIAFSSGERPATISQGVNNNFLILLSLAPISVDCLPYEECWTAQKNRAFIGFFVCYSFSKLLFVSSSRQFPLAGPSISEL